MAVSSTMLHVTVSCWLLAIIAPAIGIGKQEYPDEMLSAFNGLRGSADAISVGIRRMHILIQFTRREPSGLSLGSTGSALSDLHILMAPVLTAWTAYGLVNCQTQRLGRSRLLPPVVRQSALPLVGCAWPSFDRETAELVKMPAKYRPKR